MSKFPLKVEPEEGALRQTERRPADLVTPFPFFGGFFSFSYTRTELSSEGGRTRMKGHAARFENGKLTTETFDGELEGRAYDDALQRAQQLWQEQASAWLKSLTWLLPPSRRPDRD
jgi:hypothetical protein